ncbi:MAG: hypothetical protein L6Q67_18575 [Zoogloea sp.]|jgi:hypothetical protein|nr:hypothetical protein [Zoogloea sp.]
MRPNHLAAIQNEAPQFLQYLSTSIMNPLSGVTLSKKYFHMPHAHF